MCVYVCIGMRMLQRLGELTGDRLLVALKHSASVAAFFVVCGFGTHWTVTLHVVTRSKVRLRKMLAAALVGTLLHVSHSGEIALAGSRRLLAAAPVHFAHAVVTVAQNQYNNHPLFLLYAVFEYHNSVMFAGE